MNAIPFDTLKMARKLEAAGFPAPQAAGAADAMVEAMSGAELVTRADVERAIRRAGIGVRCAAADLRATMVAMENRLTSAISGLQNDIKLFRRDITIRFTVMTIVNTAILLAAMRFMLTHP